MLLPALPLLLLPLPPLLPALPVLPLLLLPALPFPPLLPVLSSPETALSANVYIGNLFFEPSSIRAIPSIITASVTSPTVALTVAVPTAFTVTTPSFVTSRILSSLTDHTRACSVFAGVTTATILNLFPTSTAESVICISTVVFSLFPTDAPPAPLFKSTLLRFTFTFSVSLSDEPVTATIISTMAAVKATAATPIHIGLIFNLLFFIFPI